MPLPDSVLLPARRLAIENRGKVVIYREFLSEATNFQTGMTTPTFRDKEVRALIGGVVLGAEGWQRTFRFLSSQLPEDVPSRKSTIKYDGKIYRVIGWQTSQHEDVVDITGVSP